MCWAAVTELAAPAVIIQRCNPFGHASQFGGGPRHLMGGLYDARYEGRIKWECTNPATGRYRMTCRCEHQGQVMPLCTAHVYMIQKRMAGICPRCVMPPEALALFEDIKRTQGNVIALHARGAERPVILAAITRAEELGQMMNDLVIRGIAHRCPLIVSEIS